MRQHETSRAHLFWPRFRLCKLDGSLTSMGSVPCNLFPLRNQGQVMEGRAVAGLSLAGGEVRLKGTCMREVEGRKLTCQPSSKVPCAAAVVALLKSKVWKHKNTVWPTRDRARSESAAGCAGGSNWWENSR